VGLFDAHTVGQTLLLASAPFVGSFLGVVILRLPAGLPVAGGRSRCPACGHVLAPRDLAPIVSWLVLGGRCRYCGGRIPAFYPAVEAAALLVALWAELAVPDALAWPTAVLGFLLLALAVIDERHLILPNPLVLVLAVAGLATGLAVDPRRLWAHLAAAAAGLAVLEAVGLAYRRLRGRDGLGRGDAKLFGAVGGWVGWEGLATVMLYAAAGGLLATLCRRCAGARLPPDGAVAFGPYLCLAAWLVWLYGPLQVAG